MASVQIMRPQGALLKMFLDRYGDDLASEALARCVLKMKGRYTIPTVGDLQESVDELLQKECPAEIASKIVKAISKFGSTNHKAAREYIGELGWSVVDLDGGWGTICRSTESQVISLKIHWSRIIENRQKNQNLDYHKLLKDK